MAKVGPFEKHASRYEEWFEKNRSVYESELQAVKAQLPPYERGVEVGVGSGRFAAPLGIGIGVETIEQDGVSCKRDFFVILLAWIL